MRGDFSRFSSSDSFKHYIAALMQQGRVQLDSDWNQNVEYFLNMLWKQSRDSFGTYACIGDSFRVGKDIPIDHMLQSGTWKPEGELSNSQAYIFLNATERPRTSADSINEKGSLFVQNAGGISREFNNLDLSRFRSLYVRFKALGRPFQLCQATFNCPKCSQPYKKGENQYCTNCRAELKQEYFRNENSSNKDIQTLTLRLYPQKERR
jgi:hypothetical protein